jgi:peptidoglycan/LPS O-acetylase OafA/YrhL
LAFAGAELRDLLVAGSVLAVALLVSLLWLRVVAPPASAAGQHRDRFLDGLRAVAAISVMASHYGGQISFALTGAAATPVFHNLGTCGVQMFFALTGYLFTRKAVAARGHLVVGPFLRARLRRIVPMYTAAVAFSVALVCVVTRHEPVRWHQLARQTIALLSFGFVLDGAPSIKSVPYVDVLGTIWSLPFEWLFYLFVPVLAALVASPRMLAVAGVVLAVYFAKLMTDGRGDVFCPFFLPGVLVGLLAERPPLAALSSHFHGGEGSKAFVIVLVLALVAVVAGVQDFTPARLLLMTVLFGCVVMTRPAVLERPAIAFLGDISYSIYLMHFPLLYATLAVLRGVDPAGAAPVWWAGTLLAMCGVVAAVSAVTWRCIERPFLVRDAAPPAAPA